MTYPLPVSDLYLTYLLMMVHYTFMETFKILKLRCPISIHDLFSVSSRKETTLITSFPSNDFIYRATTIWNIIAPKFKLLDYSHNISLIKSTLKRVLLEIQHLENQLDWTESDFDINRISIDSKSRLQ